MILSVYAYSHDEPESTHWWLDTPENVADKFNVGIVTDPMFHSIKLELDMDVVEIRVHIEGEPDGQKCPYCGTTLGVPHLVHPGSDSGPNDYCLHQETEDRYADDPDYPGRDEYEQERIDSAFDAECADEYEPTLEDYIDSYEPPF